MRKKLAFLFLFLGAFLSACSIADQESKAPIRSTGARMVSKAESQLAIPSSLIDNGVLIPLGEIPIPAENPMKREVNELGQMLFFDPRLSGSNEISCASCHDPEKGYGDGQSTFSKVDGSPGARNSPTIINSGYYSVYFWDGRASSLEEQALGPIENPDEMDQELDELLEEFKNIKGCETRFLAAFDDGITTENIAKALAAFQRLVVVKDTPYDSYLQGDIKALTEQKVRGLSLFAGKAFCSTCHNGENLSDNQFYNIGIYNEDSGRFAITGDERDMGRIRTPGLYGVVHTAPYMRDGSLAIRRKI